MDSRINTKILSEHFKELLEGYTVKVGVFLTYMFDPAFFEQRVLPAFFNVTNDDIKIRLKQLEEEIQNTSCNLSVYYDLHGLQNCGNKFMSPKLDIRRIPVQHKTGIFHPKNIFLLCVPTDENEAKAKPKKLIVSSMSANLTQGGWWENVEVCHTEEIFEGEKNRLRTDLMLFMNDLMSISDSADDHLAAGLIHDFLQKESEQSRKKISSRRIKTHFWREENR